MNYYDLLIKRSHSDLPPVASDVVWYYAPSKQTLYSQTNVVKHVFKNGVGAIKYSSPLTSMPTTLRGTAITNVIMPDTITSISSQAFRECTSLATATLSSNLTTINTYAFYNCTSLALTSLPSGVTSIGGSAFYGCTSLALTSLPSGVTSIGYSAFRNCTSLALTSLPSGVTSINQQTFYGCTSLALTSLPSGVTSISPQVFYNCTSLALTSLPSGLTSIGSYVFYNCTSLAITEIPSSVKTINSYAFRGCTGLTTITFKGVPDVLDQGIFGACTSLTDVYCPWYEDTIGNARWGIRADATIHYLGQEMPSYLPKFAYDTSLGTGYARNPATHYFIEKGLLYHITSSTAGSATQVGVSDKWTSVTEFIENSNTTNYECHAFGICDGTLYSLDINGNATSLEKACDLVAGYHIKYKSANNNEWFALANCSDGLYKVGSAMSKINDKHDWTLLTSGVYYYNASYYDEAYGIDSNGTLYRISHNGTLTQVATNVTKACGVYRDTGNLGNWMDSGDLEGWQRSGYHSLYISDGALYYINNAGGNQTTTLIDNTGTWTAIYGCAYSTVQGYGIRNGKVCTVTMSGFTSTIHEAKSVGYEGWYIGQDDYVYNQNGERLTNATDIPSDYDWYTPFTTDYTEVKSNITGVPTSEGICSIATDSTFGGCLNMAKTTAGRNTGIQYPNTTNFMTYGTGAFTVSFWLYAPNWDGYSQGVFSHRGDGTYWDKADGFVVYKDSNTTMDMRIGGPTNTTPKSFPVDKSSTWHHCLFCRRADGTGYWAEDGEHWSTFSGLSNYNATNGVVNVFVGGDCDWVHQAVFRLAQLRVYGRALSSREQKALATQYQELGGRIRFWAGVDTTVNLTCTRGRWTATPSPDYGGCGYHSDIAQYPDIYFYPKHGLKYSLDGGTTWNDWIFEDTPTLDLSDYGDVALYAKVISGRGTVTCNGGTVKIEDSAGGAATYTIDVQLRKTPIPKDAVFYAPCISTPNDAETGQALQYRSTMPVPTTVQGIDCLYFDGSSTGGLFSTNTTNFPSGNSSWTLSMWVKNADTTTDATCAVSFGMAGNGNDGKCAIVGKKNGQWKYGWWGNDLFAGTQTYEWTHLAMRVQASGTKAYFYLYINGVSQGYQTYSSQDITYGGIYIGNLGNGYDYWKGYIAGVRLYNRLLTVNEVAALAHEFKPDSVELCEECGEPLNAKGYCTNPECNMGTVVCEYCGERLEGLDEGWDTPRCPNENCEAWVRHCLLCGTEEVQDENQEWFCPNSGCEGSPWYDGGGGDDEVEYCPECGGELSDGVCIDPTCPQCPDYEEPDDEGGDEEEGDGEEEE